MVVIDSSNMIRSDSTWSHCCPSIYVPNKMKFSRNGALSEFSPKGADPHATEGVYWGNEGSRRIRAYKYPINSIPSGPVWSPHCPGISPSKCHSEPLWHKEVQRLEGEKVIENQDCGHKTRRNYTGDSCATLLLAQKTSPTFMHFNSSGISLKVWALSLFRAFPQTTFNVFVKNTTNIGFLATLQRSCVFKNQMSCYLLNVRFVGYEDTLFYHFGKIKSSTKNQDSRNFVEAKRRNSAGCIENKHSATLQVIKG